MTKTLLFLSNARLAKLSNFGFPKIRKGAVLFIFSLFIFHSNFLSASQIEDSLSVRNSESQIYISGGAKVFNYSQHQNQKDTPATSSQITITKLKPVKTNIEVQIESKKKEDKDKVKGFTKQLSASYFLKGFPAEQNFSTHASSGNSTSVLTIYSYSKIIVPHHYSVLAIPVSSYLLKIYKADFSTAAALSQSFFSRPPPII